MYSILVYVCIYAVQGVLYLVGSLAWNLIMQVSLYGALLLGLFKWFFHSEKTWREFAWLFWAALVNRERREEAVNHAQAVGQQGVQQASALMQLGRGLGLVGAGAAPPPREQLHGAIAANDIDFALRTHPLFHNYTHSTRIAVMTVVVGRVIMQRYGDILLRGGDIVNQSGKPETIPVVSTA